MAGKPKNAPDDPFTDEDWGPDGGRQPGDESGDLPDASTGDYEEFLKPHHLKQKQGTMELVRVTGATEFSDVVLHVNVQNRTWRIGLKTYDPGYASLIARYGKKPDEWRGKVIRYKVLPHKGRQEGYVAVRA